MLKYIEVKDWYEDLWKIIFDTNVSIENIRRMAHPKDDIESQVLSHGFFNHFYRQSRFTLIVQLCKLFDENDNQKRNFHKLFNRLTSENYDVEFKHRLESYEENQNSISVREEILKAIAQLKSDIADQSILIDKVVLHRNKLYAHSDPSSDLPPISNEELEILVKLAIRIFNTLFHKLLDTTFLFERTQDWMIDFPLRVLAEHKKNLIEELNKRTNHK